jgi:hypothetical protein
MAGLPERNKLIRRLETYAHEALPSHSEQGDKPQNSRAHLIETPGMEQYHPIKKLRRKQNNEKDYDAYDSCSAHARRERTGDGRF